MNIFAFFLNSGLFVAIPGRKSAHFDKLKSVCEVMPNYPLVLQFMDPIYLFFDTAQSFWKLRADIYLG